MPCYLVPVTDCGFSIFHGRLLTFNSLVYYLNLQFEAYICVCLYAHTWAEKPANILSDLQGICWQKVVVYMSYKIAFVFSVFGIV